MSFRTYQEIGLPSANPFEWQVQTSDTQKKAQARRDYLRKLKQRGVTEQQVMKNKATRKNLPVNLRAYTETTNSDKAPR